MATNMFDIELMAVTGGDDLTVAPGGDFANVESTGQHQRQILLNAPGELKENPTVGVGAFSYLYGEDFTGFIRNAGKQFTQDGMDVKSISVTGGVIASDAYYP
jgi:hypothetical protein